MERCWFSGRHCLDVGCNSGVLTLALATRFGTASMHGVDIDKPLVQMACRHLAAEHVAATERLAAARQQGSVATVEARALRALKKVWFEKVTLPAHEVSIEQALTSVLRSPGFHARVGFCNVVATLTRLPRLGVVGAMLTCSCAFAGGHAEQ
jgi:hypothetical protein